MVAPSQMHQYLFLVQEEIPGRLFNGAFAVIKVSIPTCYQPNPACYAALQKPQAVSDGKPALLT